MRIKNMFMGVSTALLLLSCGSNPASKNKTDITPLTFSKAKSIPLSDTDFLNAGREIPLEFNDRSMLDRYPSMVVGETSYFIYSRAAGGSVFRFSHDGTFQNLIGKVGSGPAEYVEMSDVVVNDSPHYIEILTATGIYRYSYDGSFSRKQECDIPAMSFGRAKTGYWLYTGYNKAYSKGRLFHASEDLNSKKTFLERESNMLPMMENNFHKNDECITFRESFNNTLYHLVGDSVKEMYQVSFPNMELPTDLHKKDPFDVLPILKAENWAGVRYFMENKKYVYMLISENHRQEERAIFYHWIIDKENSRELLVCLPSDLSDDSFHLAPQHLDSKNQLHFLGYNTEPDTEENPSIFIYDLNKVSILN